MPTNRCPTRCKSTNWTDCTKTRRWPPSPTSGRSASAATTRSRGVRRAATIAAWAARRATFPTATKGSTKEATRRSIATATGHMLVHSIQGTREAKVTVHGTTYSGIPVETCTTCHDRGKRIGVSFQGLMETPYHSPYAADGGQQPALHTKHYIAMEQDVHYQKGMTCQDCHTSIDVHSDGFLAAANLAAVQIECADCHGTPDKYPWELPLGFMDEFAMEPADRRSLAAWRRNSSTHTRRDTSSTPRTAILLTARGNPYENVVRDGDEVIVHTAAGKDLRMKPLKKLFDEDAVSERGMVAMKGVDRAPRTHGVLHLPRQLDAAVLRLPREDRLLAERQMPGV